MGTNRPPASGLRLYCVEVFFFPRSPFRYFSYHPRIRFSKSTLSAMLFVGGLMMAVSALACYVPARRASRLDPLAALRRD